MIWYVEDDASIRDIAIYALNSAGFETRGFEDGLTFWEALKKEKPELIVLDVMLPGMDGVELLSKMKESAEYKGIPVPEILRSGDHGKIDKWRREKALEITKLRRPDLLK